MQHERNYDDEQLAKRGLKRLDIDPKRVEMGWVLDFCAQGPTTVGPPPCILRARMVATSTETLGVSPLRRLPTSALRSSGTSRAA